MKNNSFLTALKEGATKLTGKEAADTDVDDAEVQALDSAETGLDEPEEADDLLYPEEIVVGRIFLFSAPTTETTFSQQGYDLLFLRRIKKQADKLLKLNNFDKYIKITVCNFFDLKKLKLNALSDLLFNATPLSAPGEGGKVYTHISRHLLLIGEKEIVFGELYPQAYAKIMPTGEYKGGPEPDNTMINIARALIHEVTTHAYGVILNDLLRPADDLDRENAYHAHVPSDVKVIHNPNTPVQHEIAVNSDSYRVLDEWERIVPPAKQNILALFNFASQFYRAGLSDNLRKLNALPMVRVETYFLYNINPKEKRYFALREQVAREVVSLAKYKP